MNDNYIIPLFIAGTLLITLFAFFLIMLLVVQRGRRNRAQMEKNAIIAGHKQEMLTIRIEVQDEMFNKISRELHDNVGQVLSAANMQLYALMQSIDPKSAPTVI
ncbi:MAG TPA: histidine kinase dimerization/phosphoacceptor domain-containing protein, partial [Candidatus Babeliaceae bacterium]|nr:histidine kinase dimerization/phosphoacceptor domain-containing protein [Candidatus Babeliaceae bacterium]